MDNAFHKHLRVGEASRIADAELKNQVVFTVVSSSLLRKICVIGLYAVEFLGVNFALYVTKNKRLHPEK